MMKLTDKIRRYLKLPYYTGDKIRKNWSGYAPFYMIYCKKHKWVETYPSGHYENLLCPECFKEKYILKAS